MGSGGRDTVAEGSGGVSPPAALRPSAVLISERKFGAWCGAVGVCGGDEGRKPGAKFNIGEAGGMMTFSVTNIYLALECFESVAIAGKVCRMACDLIGQRSPTLWGNCEIVGCQRHKTFQNIGNQTIHLQFREAIEAWFEVMIVVPSMNENGRRAMECNAETVVSSRSAPSPPPLAHPPNRAESTKVEVEVKTARFRS